MKVDIVAHVNDGFRPDVRFLPYLQLHEYEALLFSDPAAFAAAIGKPHLAHQFQTIRDAFATPEEINENANTAPSKRVLGAHPTYRKVLDGTLGAQGVGIERMRQECPHFREWFERLGALGNQALV